MPIALLHSCVRGGPYLALGRVGGEVSSFRTTAGGGGGGGAPMQSQYNGHAIMQLCARCKKEQL